METQNTEKERDWRDEITPSQETLKVKDGEKVIIVFANEGVKKESKDYGTSIAFHVLVENDKIPKVLYVKANNFDLLGQIKQLGKLEGLKVELSRTGSKKSDTRYKVKKV